MWPFKTSKKPSRYTVLTPFSAYVKAGIYQSKITDVNIKEAKARKGHYLLFIRCKVSSINQTVSIMMPFPSENASTLGHTLQANCPLDLIGRDLTIRISRNESNYTVEPVNYPTI